MGSAERYREAAMNGGRETSLFFSGEEACYCMGEKGAGNIILFSCFTGLTGLGGGHISCARTSSRTRMRSSKLA